MQWALQDRLNPGADHAAVADALQADIAAMHASGGAMDIAGLELRGFEAVRRKMDTPARLAKAAECKGEANAHYAAKAWLQALAGYTAGVWFLTRGNPPCPRIVGSSSDAPDQATWDELRGTLGAGTPASDEVTPPADLEAQREALRCALHLNLAAVALKLCQWSLARQACQFVLMVEGDAASPKARFRLAQALAAEGDPEAGCAILDKLLSLEPSNAEATRLAHELRARASKQKEEEVKAVDYSTMGAEEWAKLSPEQQQRALDEINRQLDEEMGEAPDVDMHLDTGVLHRGLAAQQAAGERG